MEAHSGAVDTGSGAVDAHSGSEEAHFGVVEAHSGGIDAGSGAMGLIQEVSIWLTPKPWRLIQLQPALCIIIPEEIAELLKLVLAYLVMKNVSFTHKKKKIYIYI